MKRLAWVSFAVVVGAGMLGRSLRATPANLYTTTHIDKTTLDEFDLKLHTIPAFWDLKLQSKGLTDLYVVNNLWKPGGSTGWHTHPGPSFVIVTSGTITAYEGDDPACTPHVYSVGMNFVDPGNGHQHIVMNLDPVNDATTTAVQFIPAAAARRIDVPAPGNCPF